MTTIAQHHGFLAELSTRQALQMTAAARRRKCAAARADRRSLMRQLRLQARTRLAAGAAA